MTATAPDVIIRISHPPNALPLEQDDIERMLLTGFYGMTSTVTQQGNEWLCTVEAEAATPSEDRTPDGFVRVQWPTTPTGWQ